ncbi:MAG: TetR/AcrR family transcriptional regulator [Myxococcales bacterium]|nr:TetR/AcrR family transcriptional regulator [Myxococcales bacterium]HIK83617.1 TetR/AcrR family transcriptional regulator [Myxococcales bacterium]
MSLHAAEERRSASRAETRGVILDATEELLLSVGVRGFSVRKLVDQCGYSAPTIYHHFSDKDGLIDALLEQRLTSLASDLKRVPLVEDPVENLRSLSRAFAQFGLRNPTHYQLLMQVREHDDRMIESAEEARRLMETPAERIDERKWIIFGDLESFRQAIWTMVHGIVSMHALRPDVEWREDLLDRSIEGIIRGWLMPESARTLGPCEQLGQEE